MTYDLTSPISMIKNKTKQKTKMWYPKYSLDGRVPISKEELLLFQSKSLQQTEIEMCLFVRL